MVDVGGSGSLFQFSGVAVLCCKASMASSSKISAETKCFSCHWVSLPDRFQKHSSLIVLWRICIQHERGTRYI